MAIIAGRIMCFIRYGVLRYERIERAYSPLLNPGFLKKRGDAVLEPVLFLPGKATA
jgi:hypothetical protein